MKNRRPYQLGEQPFLLPGPYVDQRARPKRSGFFILSRSRMLRMRTKSPIIGIADDLAFALRWSGIIIEVEGMWLKEELNSSANNVGE
jgi:hypothetical protein